MCFSSLSVFIERPSRRAEVVSYAAIYQLDYLYHLALEKRWIKQPIQWLGMLILIISSALIVSHHNDLPTLISKWLLGIEQQQKTNQKMKIEDE